MICYNYDMKIVVEYTLITSFIANFLSLALTERVLKTTARLKWLAAILGAAIDLLCPLFHIKGVFKFLLLIFILSLTTLISFKYCKFFLFLRNLALILLITCLFGGINEGVSSFLGEVHLLVVDGVLLLAYLIIKVIHKSIVKANTIKNFSYSLTIVDEGKIIAEEGYLDSGNVLQDNITKKPIILINYEVFCKLYEGVSLLSAITKSYDFKSFKNGHYVEINSVGGGAKMLVFSVDEVRVGEDKSFKDVMLGLSFSGFEKSFGKNVLLNANFV